MRKSPLFLALTLLGCAAVRADGGNEILRVGGAEGRYANIQAAVDALPPVLTKPYEIVVAPGVYRETVTLKKIQTAPMYPLTLRAEPIGSAVIDAENLREFGLVLEDQKHVVLSGLAVRNATGYGNIFLFRCFDVTISHCLSYGARNHDGINLSGSSNVNLLGNTLALNRRAGLYLVNTSNNNTIKFNLFYGNQTGIEIGQYPGFPLVQDYNAFARNTAQPAESPSPHSLLLAQELFKETKAGDFHLVDNSPCPNWGAYGEADESDPGPTPAQEYFPVNLTAQANRALQDEKAGDGVGGWTDQGDVDLRHLPAGQQKFGGIPFWLPATPQERGVVILKGEHTAGFPAAVTGVPIGQKVDTLYFLHASAWGSGNEVYKCQIQYANGAMLELPMNYRVNIGEWWNPEDLSAAPVAWSAYHPVHAKIRLGLYCFAWENPYPLNPIKSVDLVSAGQSTPLIVALTGKKLTRRSAARLNLFASSPSGGPGDRIEIHASCSTAEAQTPLTANLTVCTEDGRQIGGQAGLPLVDTGAGAPEATLRWTVPELPSRNNCRIRCEIENPAHLLIGTKEIYLPIRGAAKDLTPAAEVDPQRPLGGTNLIYACEIQPLQRISRYKFERGERPPKVTPEIFDHLKAAGGTVAHLVCWWSYLEPNPFEYDFSSIDAALAECRRVGLKASISVWMGDHNIPEFCRHENMIDQNGRPFLAERGTNQGKGFHPSIWGPSSREHFGALIRQLCRQYLDNDQVVAWGFMYQHIEVALHDRSDAQGPILYDYSPWAETAFRDYLRTEQKLSLEMLNARYGQTYDSWEKVTQPKPQAGFDTSARWHDFQDFRIHSIRESFRFVFDQVRQVDRERKKILFTFNPRYSLDLCRDFSVACDYTGSEEATEYARFKALRLFYDIPLIVEPTSIPPSAYELGAGFFNALANRSQGYLWIGTHHGFPLDAAAELFSRYRSAWTVGSRTKPAFARFALLTSNETCMDQEKTISHHRRLQTSSNYDLLLRLLLLNGIDYENLDDQVAKTAGYRLPTSFDLLLDTDSKVMRQDFMTLLLKQIESGATLVMQPETGRFCREAPEPQNSLAWRLGWQAEIPAPLTKAMTSVIPAQPEEFFGIEAVTFINEYDLSGFAGQAIRAQDGSIIAIMRDYGQGRAIMLRGEIDWKQPAGLKTLTQVLASRGIKPQLQAAPMVRMALRTVDDRKLILLFNEKSADYASFPLRLMDAENAASYRVRCVTDGFAEIGDIGKAQWEKGLPVTLAPNELRIYELAP